MQWIREFILRALVLMPGRRFDSDLEEELESHRALQAEENQRSGMTADQAEREAARRLGNRLWLREESRGRPRLPAVSVSVSGSGAAGISLVGTPGQSLDLRLLPR